MTDKPPADEIERPRESAIKKRLENSDRAQKLNREIQKSGALLKEGVQDLTSNRREKVETIKKQIKKNKITIGALIAVMVLMIGGIIYWQNQNRPYKASPAFGICRNFLELYTQYPDYIRIASVTERAPSKLEHVVRVWYSQRDAFGQSRMERMECFFGKTSDGIRMSKVMIDTRELPYKDIKSFNAALPAIQKIDTDLTVPSGFPSRIQDLKLDYDRMRKRYF